GMGGGGGWLGRGGGGGGSSASGARDQAGPTTNDRVRGELKLPHYPRRRIDRPRGPAYSETGAHWRSDGAQRRAGLSADPLGALGPRSTRIGESSPAAAGRASRGRRRIPILERETTGRHDHCHLPADVRGVAGMGGWNFRACHAPAELL